MIWGVFRFIFVPLHLYSPAKSDSKRELLAEAEHYILEGVTDALFLDFETTTIEEDKNKRRGNCHGV